MTGEFVPGQHTVGFVGLGNMGAPMVRALAGAGYEVIGYDLRREQADTLAERVGIKAASSLDELARSSDVVIMMLPNGPAVRDAVMGVGGQGDRLVVGLTGKVLLDMGSSDPQLTVALAEQLRSHSVDLVDAPVSGGVAGAERSELSIMVGGDQAVVARCQPLFECFGQNILFVGACGAGHAMKALNNLLSATGLIATAEVLLVGRSYGLDPELMLHALNASTGHNNSTKIKFPRFVLTGSYGSGFALDLMLKDVRSALAMAVDMKVDTPLSALVVSLADQARAELPDRADHTEVVSWLQQRSGISLESGV